VSPLLSIPNVSEGRDATKIAAIARAFDARLLDVHTDPDHHRTVFTLAGEPRALAPAVLEGARQAVASVDLSGHDGLHPRVGAIDVVPVVYLRESDRGAACAEALVCADLIGDQLGVPVFLYGALAGGRSRAVLRRGGPTALANRLREHAIRPDFGPTRLHPTAGAVLVGARPPLVAFNLQLAPPATVEQAKEIAARIREGGPEGLPAVRAIGLWLALPGVAQVSTNVEDHLLTPLRDVVAAVRRHATVTEAELVGLAPRAALDGFPGDVPVRNLATVEDALQASA
jgi:glutamate formiminotransferase / 5-formyltetrahydrofolate cyclo-ligase